MFEPWQSTIRCASFTSSPPFPYFCLVLAAAKGTVKTMFQHIACPAIMSLGTCSSSGHHPHQHGSGGADTGISKDVSEIVLPLGATMHMDGSCFSCVLKIAFLFGVFGKPFNSIGDFILIILVAVLSSVGMSGVPGGGYIGEFIMCSVFFPDQLAVAYPIAITIGNLVDPPRYHDQLRRRLCGLLHRLPFRRRQDWLQKARAARNA